jgi:NAD(P)-binding Rossmann-like domain
MHLSRIFPGRSYSLAFFYSIQPQQHLLRRLGMKRTMSLSPVVHNYEVVVVGGGMGGLYTAHQLLNKYNFKQEEIVVLESRRWVGGRLITTHHEKSNNADDKQQEPEPMFNDFAWRIGETNSMMMQVAKEFGIELVEQFTPPPEPVDEQEPKLPKKVWDTTPRAIDKPPYRNLVQRHLIRPH